MMHLTVETFERMTLSEFYAAYDGYAHQRTMEQREAWERCRTVATYVVAPWMKGTATPQEILPLPWDDTTEDVNGEFDDDSMKRRREIAEKMIAEYGKAGQFDD